MTYDTLIIGAGINGCATAHFLVQGGQKVALVDREGIAAGGSGAAGAFISPKISKGGPLKSLMEEAYLFALEFYRAHFAKLIRIAPLIHFAKYADDNEKVRAFRAATTLPLLDGLPDVVLPSQTQGFEHVVLAQSGLVDAVAVCKQLAEGADLYREDINIIKYENGFWQVGGVRAKRIVLATGAYRSIVSMPHLRLRAVWGHRIDIHTSTSLPWHLHREVSVAATDQSGFSAIGATHDVHYHPQSTAQPYDYDAGRATLLNKAAKTVCLEDVEVLKDYTGLRSGSDDYYPLCGRVVDAEASIDRYPELLKGVSIDAEVLVYHPELYMINGSGGYGFVLGPLLARYLSRSLLAGEPISKALDPTRFLYRWAKKGGSAAEAAGDQ